MIAFDLQAIQSAAHGERGIARYVFDLARTLAERHPGVVDAFLWNDRLPWVDRIGELDLGERLQSFSAVRGRTVDVLHVNSPFELLPIGEVGVPVRARRLVVTCYDLIPYRFPDRYLADVFTSARYRTRLGMLAAADAIVTDSQSAADDVAGLLGVSQERLTVLGAGVSDRFRPPTTPLAERIRALREAIPGIQARFVLVPTGMDWRKNYAGAIAAFARLPDAARSRHQLVLACKVDQHQRNELDRLCHEHGVTDRVLVTGFVPDDVLVLLNQTAELVFFPSYYEGFGLPVLEARSCGARVICSGVSSLPEVLPDERALFNPWDTDDTAATLLAALDDPSVAAALDRVPDAGFTWARAADRLVTVYDSVRPEPAVPSPQRKRLGIVTLMPPTPSGIADHSERLVTALHHDVDSVEVAVFVERTASWSQLDVPYQVHDLATLPARWAAGELDSVVYCFGNNRFHRSFLPMLEVVPGHAFLHDVRLRGVFDRLRVDRFAQRWYDHDVDDDTLFAAPVVHAALTTLVQSAHAADLVRSDAGAEAIDIGPHPCAAVASTEPIRDGGPDYVVSAGIADESKCSDVVAEAMRQLVARRSVRPALVGLGGERFVGDGDAVEVTGQVDDGEFDAWLRRAGVLVQLRRTTNGESSGVVAHALARGVPLIVSDIGAMAELPDEVAVKVPVDVSAGELADTVEVLLDDEPRRLAMRAAALAYAARETPLAQARRLVAAVFGDGASG